MRLPEKIRELTRRAGVKQAELARAIETDPSRVSEWVNEKGEPSVGQLLAVARYFGVPLDYLADDSQDGPPAPPPKLSEREEAILGIVRARERVEGPGVLTIEEIAWRLSGPVSRPFGVPSREG